MRSADEASIALAVQALKDGKLALLPTETVYGLAGSAADPAAVAAIYEAKGRPSFNPLIAHVADLKTATRVAHLNDRALALAEAFWPGPLTLVAPVRDTDMVCDLARAGLDTVAVRVPAHPAAREVLSGFGGAVAAPSANRSGRPSPTTFDDASEETGFAAEAGVDGGPCTVGLESTGLFVGKKHVRLLRPGGLAREDIERITGPLSEAATDAKRSPGRLALHYAPDAPVRLEASGPGAGEAYLSFGAYPDGEGVFHLSRSGDLTEAASRLFALLRAADRLDPTAIAVGPIPGHGLGEAINDRLKRAAGFIG